MGKREPGRSVTSRALSLLAAFDAGHRSLSLSEIARRSGLPVATAHRLLRDLEEWHALERCEDGSYQIGSRLWAIGQLAPVHAELREVALPHLQDLFAATREAVQLAVLDGDRALTLAHIAGARAAPSTSRPGSRVPLHTTGTGKVLLAAAPPDVRRRVLGRLERVTPHTVVDPVALGERLRGAAERGWAQSREELTLGSRSLAVPVRGPAGEARAAIGLVAPAGRADLLRMLPVLRAASRAVTAALSRAPARAAG
jgi:DNA-binding IclR family transcriptional regulator